MTNRVNNIHISVFEGKVSLTWLGAIPAGPSIYRNWERSPANRYADLTTDKVLRLIRLLSREAIRARRIRRQARQISAQHRAAAGRG